MSAAGHRIWEMRARTSSRHPVGDHRPHTARPRLGGRDTADRARGGGQIGTHLSRSGPAAGFFNIPGYSHNPKATLELVDPNKIVILWPDNTVDRQGRRRQPTMENMVG